MDNCSSVSDCVSVFEGSQVLKKCYFDEESIGYCDCDTWFGYTGDNCTVITSQVVFWRVVSIIFLLLCSFSLTWCILTIRKILDIIIEPSAPNRLDMRNTKNLMLQLSCCLLLAFVAIVVQNIEYVLAAFDASYFEIASGFRLLEESSEIVAVKNSVLYRVASAFVVVLNVVTSLLIGCSWLDIVASIDTVLQLLPHPKYLKFFKVFSYTFSLVLTVFSLGLTAFNFTRAAVITTQLTGMAVFVLFVVGRKYMIKALKKAKLKDNETLRFIKFSTRVHTTLIFVFMLCLVLYSLFLSERENVGQFQSSSVFISLAGLCGYTLATFNLWYVNRLCENLMAIVNI